MIDKLKEHRAATCKRQKIAWKDTIERRLEKETSSKIGENKNEEKSTKKMEIPIVIWGLEASPSFFDFNNEASKPLKNRIRTSNLHENYLYNDLDKDGNNYGVRIIKNWINEQYAPDAKEAKYSYDSLKTQLSGTDCSQRKFKLPLEKNKENSVSLKKPIHLVYDIFPEWHGLPVSQGARDSCYNKSYMCSKVDDFKQHVEHIQHVFEKCNGKVIPGVIHFVWLGTRQKHKTKKSQEACHQFFLCLKIEFNTIQLYYNPKGFVTMSDLEACPIDCPADFLAIGVPTDWSEHIAQAGYHTVKALRNEQPNAVLQKLNGFREEENLDISILESGQVNSWFDG